MRKTIVLLVAFCVLSGFEQPQEEQGPGIIEEWRCLNVVDWFSLQLEEGGYEDIPGDRVVVTLTRRLSKDDKSGSGEVSVTGITHRATFLVEGLERRWDFGENGEYAFVINPQGGGAYYDFSDADIGEIVEPSQTYGCVSNRAHKKKETPSQADNEHNHEDGMNDDLWELDAPTTKGEELPVVRIDPHYPREAKLAERMRRELEEELRQRAVESGLLDEYKARIRQRIESNWVKPARSREDLKWVVLLDMLPGNEVGGITFEQFNGTETDRRSVEAAIRRSSPLPAPPVPELFERQLRVSYPAPYPAAAAAATESEESLPIVRVDPIYPRGALMGGIEGYVKFELLISPYGTVRDVKVTEAVPGDIFVRNAVRAIRKWKFKPRVVSGATVEFWTKASIVFELDG